MTRMARLLLHFGQEVARFPRIFPRFTMSHKSGMLPHPFIQTGDIRNADHTITQYSQTYSDAGLAQSKLWAKGTICITIAANIAETAVLGFDACFPDSVIGLVADPRKADGAKLDAFLKLNERDILTHAGRISHEMAQAFHAAGDDVVALEYLKLARAKCTNRYERPHLDYEIGVLQSKQ